MNLEEKGRYEHYQMVRNNAAYRMFLMQEEMAAEHLPSWSTPEPITEERIILHRNVNEKTELLLREKLAEMDRQLQEHFQHHSYSNKKQPEEKPKGIVEL